MLLRKSQDLHTETLGKISMSLLTDDHLTRLSFSVYENPTVYAFLIGSGHSRAAEIPTGWEITLDLIRRLAMMQGEEDQPDWAAWYREKAGKEPDYSELVGELGLSRDERRSILHSYIEPTDDDRAEGRRVPTAAHYALADLVKLGYVRVIITTNFDRLLESAMREREIEPTVISSVDALKGAEPLIHSNCYLLKLHGDYKDSRILNTDNELSNYPPEYDAILDRIFDEHGLIVCGWSGEWDHALRAAILRCPARRYTMYWTARGKLSAQAEELISQRKGCPVTIADADSFLVEIRDRIEILARTHRQNPQSVDLLVNSTKRYLGQPEFRIQLDELLTIETHSLVEKLNAAGLTGHGNWNADEFRRRVAIYEAISEPLARMAGVLGRWGNDDEIPHMKDIVRFLFDHANREREGLVSLISLQCYPAVLMVTAYGLGLVRSQRWRALHDLLSSELESRNSADSSRIVEKLFLWSWEGGDNQYWRLYEGMERHKTALSDHLCALFEKWGESYVGIVSDFEELYETWEIIGSLTYCECYTVEQLQESLSNDSMSGRVWMPVGRSAWNDRNRRRIIRLIRADEMRQSLLDAGLCKGHTEFLEAAIKNLEQTAGRVAWMRW